MNIDVKDINGKSVGKVELPEDIFGLEMNEHVLYLATKAYRANRRQGTHSTKTRAFVSGGGKKPFKQKGTGNARQGTSRSPNMPGGAISHGPLPRSYRQDINKKAKQLALKVALSDRLRHKRLFVVKDFAISEYSTKHVKNMLGNFNVSSALLADERKDKFLHKSANNIYKVKAETASEINCESVLRHENIFISENALTQLVQRLGE